MWQNINKGALIMQSEQPQLLEMHSPREQYELTAQLGHLDEVRFEGDQQHLHFNEDENPFSYYNEINTRESHSEEEDTHYNAQQHNSAEHKENRPVLHAGNVAPLSQHGALEVGQNINDKPAIPLLQSPKAKPEITTKQQDTSSPVAAIKFLKEAEFDLTKLSPKPQKSPQTQRTPASEERYQQQMERDLQQLKNSLSAKESKKKSGKQQPSPTKLNFNKTFAPSPQKGKFLQEGDADLQQEEMKMLSKIALEKKNANYQMLKQWDGRRAQSLALHGKMIEVLQSEMDMRIKSSLQNFQNYQTFFRQKARQEEKYVTAPVINTRYALQNNSLSKNVYINCSVILNSLCDQNASRCKKINDFVHLIRTNILKELTEAHLHSSQKELLTVREKISTLKASLKKCNIETEQRSTQLASLFKEQTNNLTNKHEKDFYRTQLSFLRKAIEQIQLQKKLGQYCLQYYHTAVQQELKRSGVIREAMVTYSIGLKQTYNFEIECEMQQMGKNEELKLIQQYFSLEDMFDERTLQLLKAKNNIKEELTIDNFTAYLQKFGYEMFDSRVILLKQFNVKYMREAKGKEKSEVDCYIAITVDNFLHLTFATGRNILKPDITIKISSKYLQVKAAKDEFVDIVKKEEKKHSMMSYFWDNKIDKVHRIRFAKKDSKEEFMDYITKLMIGNY